MKRNRGFAGNVKKLLSAISSYLIVLMFFGLYFLVYSFYKENTIFAATSAGCGVYTGGGDWIITDTCYVWDETIPVSGNIYIKNGGSLFLGYSGSSTSPAKLVFGAFKYRKPITITNQISSALSDYQVKLTIDTASLISNNKMTSDCSDIRFAWYDSSTGEYKEIPYWIESGCNSANTIIWVKVPSIPASSSTTIYMYYGNTTPVQSSSSSNNVFLFFDDFDGSGVDTNVWNQEKSPQTTAWESATFTVSNSEVYIYPGYYRGKARLYTKDPAFQSSDPYIIEMYFRVPAATTYYRNVVLYALDQPIGTTSSNNEWVQARSDHVYLFGSKLTVTRGGTSNYVQQTDYYIDSTSKLLWKIIVDNSQVKAVLQLGSQTVTHTLSPSSPLDGNQRYINIYDFDDYGGDNYGSGGFYVDWIRVRKYASTEPTYSIGSEQTGWSQYIYIYSGGTLYVYSGSSID